MEHPSVDKFFYYASRFVIVFPIIAVALILLFAKNPLEKTQSVIVPTPSTETEKFKEVSQSIDLNASYICSIKNDKNVTTEAYLKNKSLFVRIQEKGTTKYTLFKKDCLYSWQENRSTGVKTCGLSQYVSMAENLSSFNMLNPDSLMKTFLGDKNLPSFSRACKKQEITEDKLFEVPKSVTFKEKKSL